MKFAQLISMFQFHKVRLKGKDILVDITSFMFQFHKVRLKENQGFFQFRNDLVSIP